MALVQARPRTFHPVGRPDGSDPQIWDRLFGAPTKQERLIAIIDGFFTLPTAAPTGKHSIRSGGLAATPNANDARRAICKLMEEESAVFHRRSHENAYAPIERFLLLHNDVLETLDLVQLLCRIVVNLNKNFGHLEPRGETRDAETVIRDVNKRFEQHAVGFRFEGGIIIRVDDQFTHREMVEPTIGLLREKGFERALSDFMDTEPTCESSSSAFW